MAPSVFGSMGQYNFVTSMSPAAPSPHYAHGLTRSLFFYVLSFCRCRLHHHSAIWIHTFKIHGDDHCLLWTFLFLSLENKIPDCPDRFMLSRVLFAHRSAGAEQNYICQM